MSAYTVLGVDPGPTQSGYCLFDGAAVRAGTIPNEELLRRIVGRLPPAHAYVFEKVQGYGKVVGASVFETCFWTGRFFEAAMYVKSCWGVTVARLPFPQVKQHLCRGSRGKDADVRQALLRRFGGLQAAKGTKAAPGPLYGVSGHAWSALGKQEEARACWQSALQVRPELAENFLV